MKQELTQVQKELLEELKHKGFNIWNTKGNKEEESESINDNKKYEELLNFANKAEKENEEATIECSSCNVILAIDDVIINTLAPEGRLKKSYVDNLLKLAQVRSMYIN